MPCLTRRPSYEAKKNVLSFLMGPPRVPPNWFCWKSGRGVLVRVNGFRVQHGVPEELERATMKTVCAGLRDHVDDRTGIAAVLRVKRVRDHAKFFNRVGRRLNRGQVREQVVSVATVHRVIVGPAAAAIDGDHAGLVRTIESVVTELRLHAGLQLQQLICIAGIQWQFRR